MVLGWEATAEMEWVGISSGFADALPSLVSSRLVTVPFLAFQIKVTALWVEWEWVAITAVDTELLMAWADTVSSVLPVFRESVANVCLPVGGREGWWAVRAVEDLCREKGKRGGGSA